MPNSLFLRLFQSPWLIIAAGCTVAGAGAWFFTGALRSRQTPEQRETFRRLQLHQRGRMGEAVVLHADEEFLHYSYRVGGVSYSATQDIRALGPYLPAAPHLLLGPALLKYQSQNPANSMLVCENWSGLLAGPHRQFLQVPQGEPLT